MKNAVVTICSVNYLAHAKILAESIKKFNPDYRIFLGLLDRIDQYEIDETFLESFTLIEIHQLAIPDFNNLIRQDSLSDLNNRIKPYLFKFIYDTFPEILELHYFDPDIQVFGEFSILKEALSKKDIIFIPHYVSPYEDAEYYHPNILDIENKGLYNSGYFGTKNSRITQNLLKDWIDNPEIYLRLNQIPDKFKDDSFECKYLGANMAYWNLHERKLSEEKGKFIVNDQFPLLFYHFSGYDLKIPYLISKNQNRYEFTDRHDMASLFDLYAKSLKENGVERFKNYFTYYKILDDSTSLNFIQKLKKSIHSFLFNKKK